MEDAGGEGRIDTQKYAISSGCTARAWIRKGL